MSTHSEQNTLPQSIDIESLPPEAQNKVQEIVNTIEVENSQSVLQYGISVQKDIADFADNILMQVRSKDTGFAGEVLTDLSLKVKALDVNSLSEKGFLSKIPIIGNMVDSMKRFTERYKTISLQIDTIVDELDKARMNLVRDITLLDELFTKNGDYIQELDIFIVAGKLKLDRLKAETLPKLEEKAALSGDTADAQKVHDFNQLITRFEKKIHDLNLSRMIALQSAPQIRLIQNNDQTLVEKIQSSILNTIPLWKNQIVIAISLFRQKKALEVQKGVTDTTNELLQKNAEMLKQGSVDIAQEGERGIVDIETLQKVNADLISTIDETLEIQKEGRAKRQEAETEIVKLEAELRNKLLSLKGEK